MSAAYRTPFWMFDAMFKSMNSWLRTLWKEEIRLSTDDAMTLTVWSISANGSVNAKYRPIKYTAWVTPGFSRANFTKKTMSSFHCWLSQVHLMIGTWLWSLMAKFKQWEAQLYWAEAINVNVFSYTTHVTCNCWCNWWSQPWPKRFCKSTLNLERLS